MAEFPIDTPDIIADFLRSNTADPRNRAEASRTENITATGGQTTITLAPTVGTVSAISELNLNGDTLSKWGDYFWDYQNQKITFYTALSLNDDVEIIYKQGTKNWIYSDRPDDQLSALNFPIISVFTVVNPGKRLGQTAAPVETVNHLQIDIWVKDDSVFTIINNKYSSEALARYLANRITRAFDNNETELHPVLYDYNLDSGPRAAPYSLEYQAHHVIVEVSLKGLKSGRIET